MSSVELSFKSNTTYVFQKKIGVGGSADAFLYSRRTEGCPEQLVVLKILKNEDEQTLAELINDGEKLNSLKHPHILRTFGYEKISHKKLALILEYIPGNNLKNIIEKIEKDLSENLGAYMAQKLLSALSTAHEAQVIHGDISSRNILLSNDGDIKLADFGIATKLGSGSEAPLKGSLDYLSPEVWSGQRHSMASDIFSLAMVIFEILNGAHPFSALDRKESERGLKHFLESKPWEKWPRWKAFFERAFEKREESAQALLEDVPPLNLSESQVRKSLSTWVQSSEKKPLKSFTETMTLAFARLPYRKISKIGFALMAFTFTVLAIVPVATGGDVQMGHRLKPCALTVLSQPWGEVFLNGKSLGFTPLINTPLPSGYHHFTWRNYRGQTVNKTIMAYDNGLLNIQIKK